MRTIIVLVALVLATLVVLAGPHGLAFISKEVSREEITSALSRAMREQEASVSRHLELLGGTAVTMPKPSLNRDEPLITGD